MIEFSEDFSTRYDGISAVASRVLYRLKVLEGEIPRFNGGLNLKLYSYGNDLDAAIRRVLPDFKANISVSDGRVHVGNISVEIPRGLL